MNAKQQAKYHMYRTTQAHCNNNAAIAGSNQSFSSALAEISAIIESVGNHETVLSKKITGITLDKKETRKQLAAVAYLIASQVFAYASKTKNNSLKSQVDFSLSDLARIKDELFAPAVKNIYNAATENLEHLADYGITAADLAELKTWMDNHQKATPVARVAIGSRSSKAKSLTALFKTGDLILKEQMDKLVTGFKKTFPLFVTEYYSARKILTPPSRSKQLQPVPSVS